MSHRFVLLLALLTATGAGAYFYCQVPEPPKLVPVAERFALSPIVQEADEFDDAYVTDAALLQAVAAQKIEFPFKPGDRVAWIGSSSTYIGVWCRTMAFLLRTRHPELKLEFARHSTGGGTFATGAARMGDWLERSRPTLVFLNYGCNDASYGKSMLDELHAGMRGCVERAQGSGARIMLMTHQSGDIRQTGAAPYFRRKHYADDMLAQALENHWPIVDVHHPLEQLQAQGRKLDDGYTINWDHIHLTDSAYVAWGFFLYEGLNPPAAESILEIDARDGRILTAKNCRARTLSTGAELAFERTDDVLPILPPSPLPAGNSFRSRAARGHSYANPTAFAPSGDHDLPPDMLKDMESHARYLLKIAGLAPGNYAVECNGTPMGSVSDTALAAGVNLNTLQRGTNLPAPWNELAGKVWEGTNLSDIEKRTLTFKLKPASK